MAPHDSSPTRLRAERASLVPWAHGPQLQAMGDIVAAILEPQTACQAPWARSCGKPEAALTRCSRLLHHERLEPRQGAEAGVCQARPPLPQHGKVRLALDWTRAADQPLWGGTLVGGRRAVPLDWRAYQASGLQGGMHRYDLAILRRAVGRVAQGRGPPPPHRAGRSRVGCRSLGDFPPPVGAHGPQPGESRYPGLGPGKCFKVGHWRFRGKARPRSFGALPSWERCPHRLWGAKRRARDAKGPGGMGHWGSKRSYAAPAAVNADRQRGGCEAGWRDAPGWRGCAQARMAPLTAWSRLWALLAMALLVRTSRGSTL